MRRKGREKEVVVMMASSGKRARDALGSWLVHPTAALSLSSLCPPSLPLVCVARAQMSIGAGGIVVAAAMADTVLIHWSQSFDSC